MIKLFNKTKILKRPLKMDKNQISPYKFRRNGRKKQIRKLPSNPNESELENPKKKRKTNNYTLNKYLTMAQNRYHTTT